MAKLTYALGDPCCEVGYHFAPSNPVGKRCVGDRPHTPSVAVDCPAGEECRRNGHVRGECAEGPKCDRCLWCERDDLIKYEEDKPTGWDKCMACGEEAVWTALGCIDANPQAFISWFLGSAIKIAGGIAFLLMLWGGVTMMTSTGDPEKLNQGKSILTSAITGLLFIIFSVLLLKIIGVDIFQLPGFSWGI